MHPEDLKYSPQHLWLKDEGGGRVRLGITYQYQEQIKSVAYLELPQVGARLQYGEPFGAIESSKVSTDLTSPVNGTVSAVNTAVVDKPGLINRDPYGKGWLVVVQLDSPGTLPPLLSASSYLAATARRNKEGLCQP